MTNTELTATIENLLRANTKAGYFDSMTWDSKALYVEYAIREVEKKGTVTISATFHLGTDGDRVFQVNA